MSTDKRPSILKQEEKYSDQGDFRERMPFSFWLKVEEAFLHFLSYCYGFVGIAGVAAYLATIRDLHVSKKMSANLTTYFIWTITTAVTFLYSLFVVRDLLFQVISGLGFFFCFLVLALVVKLRYSIQKIAIHSEEDLPPGNPTI